MPSIDARFMPISSSARQLNNIDHDNIKKILIKEISHKTYDTIESKIYLIENYNIKSGFSFKKWSKNKEWLKFPSDVKRDCIHMSERIIGSLDNEFNAEIIGASMPVKHKDKKGPKFDHVAVLIKYKGMHDDFNSYVLLDPGLFIIDPIVLNKNNHTKIIKREYGNWKFILQGDEIHCFSEQFGLDQSGNPDRIIYSLKKFSNYNDHVEQIHLLSNLAPSIMVTDKNGLKVARITIDLESQVVNWRAGHERGVKSFKDILSNDFPENFINLSEYLSNISIVKQHILKIINNRNELLNLENQCPSSL